MQLPLWRLLLLLVVLVEYWLLPAGWAGVDGWAGAGAAAKVVVWLWAGVALAVRRTGCVVVGVETDCVWAGAVPGGEAGAGGCTGTGRGGGEAVVVVTGFGATCTGFGIG